MTVQLKLSSSIILTCVTKAVNSKISFYKNSSGSKIDHLADLSFADSLWCE